MSCLKKNCSIDDDSERMIVCWLCHNLCHYKCTGLPTTINEAVRNHDGLNWFCFNCRKPAVEFYRFFQGNKNRFLEIEKNASLLLASVIDYGKLYTDFASLDSLKSPPQSSPKRRKSSRNVNKSKDVLPAAPGTPKTDEQLHNNHPVIVGIPSTSASAKSVHFSAVSNTNNIAVLNSPLPIAPIPEVVSDVDFNPGTSSRQQTNLSDIGNNSNGPKKKSKTIFAARLSSSTSVEDVTYFINSKFETDIDLTVIKFNYPEQRSKASFKITVPEDAFSTIIDSNFWPENTIVREFIYKEKRKPDIAYLPQREISDPKN